MPISSLRREKKKKKKKKKREKKGKKEAIIRCKYALPESFLKIADLKRPCYVSWTKSPARYREFEGSDPRTAYRQRVQIQVPALFVGLVRGNPRLE